MTLGIRTRRAPTRKARTHIARVSSARADGACPRGPAQRGGTVLRLAMGLFTAVAAGTAAPYWVVPSVAHAEEGGLAVTPEASPWRVGLQLLIGRAGFQRDVARIGDGGETISDGRTGGGLRVAGLVRVHRRLSVSVSAEYVVQSLDVRTHSDGMVRYDGNATHASFGASLELGPLTDRVPMYLSLGPALTMMSLKLTPQTDELDGFRNNGVGGGLQAAIGILPGPRQIADIAIRTRFVAGADGLRAHELLLAFGVRLP